MIKALMVFEILGRPKEHIKKTLEELIDSLNNIPGIKISKKTIHEPKEVEEKNLYTTFAETEIEADNLNSLILIVFRAMPSHIEIVEPEEMKIRNFDLSTILSDLVLKLHRYDEIAKSITIERNMLINKLKEMQEKINNLEKNIKEPNKTKKNNKKKTKKSIKNKK